MDVDLEILKELFDEKLKPILTDIGRLKEDHDKFIDFVTEQSNYIKELEKLKIDMNETKKFNDNLNNKLNRGIWAVFKNKLKKD